jgi:hypothetical protein
MSRSARRTLIAAVTLLLLIAAVASLPDSASAVFSQGVSVSPAGYDSDQQRVAYDRQGDALVVWVRTTQEYPHYRRAQIRFRSHTGTWGSIVTVSPSNQDPRAPKVALDDDGDGVVVWHAFDGVDYRVYARRISRAGSLGSVKTLTAAGLNIYGTDVAVDPDGDAVVTWAEWHEDGSVLPRMRRFSRTGSLSSAVTLASAPAAAEPPAVGIDRQGDAVLAWANDNVVQARTLSAAGTLGPLETVSADLSPIDRHFTAKVAIDRDGDALVTWVHWTAADQGMQIWGRWISNTGTVGNVRQLTPSSHPDVSNYSISGDLDGDVLLTWDRFPSEYMYVRRITRTGTVGETVRVTTYGRLHTVRVDDDGDGVIVWQGRGVNDTPNVRARRISQWGGLGATSQLVAGIGRYPVIAVSPTGRAIVAWERGFQFDVRIQASVGP